MKPDEKPAGRGAPEKNPYDPNFLPLCDAVRGGLPYIATHPDFNCPVPGGYIPDIGATIAYVEAATGRRPDAVIGKPNPYIVQAAAERFGCRLEELCMVGDRLYTDIACGVNAGVDTALVLTGEATAADAAVSPTPPTAVYQDMEALLDALRRAEKQEGVYCEANEE